MIVFLPVYLAEGPKPGPELLWVIPVFALFVIVACGFSMIVAAGQVYFRDLKNFLNYGLRIWLYASPILYLAVEVPERYKFLLVINPIAPLLAAWSVDLRPRPRARPERPVARPRLGRRAVPDRRGLLHLPGA